MQLQELADRQEIVDLVTAYTRAVDTRHWDDLDRVFTPDAVLDYTSPGGPAGGLVTLKPWLEQGLAGFDRYQHVIGQVAIAFDGPDRARATAYFTNPMVARRPDGSEALYEVGGYYHHRLVRTGDGWRSAHLVDELVWSRGF